MTSEEAGVVVMPDALREFVARLFVEHGFGGEDAATIADHLVEADLRGVYSHGVLRLDQYLKRVRAGGINPRPNVRVIQERAATALLDGDNGMGHVVGLRAMEMAIRKAKDAGVAYVGARASNHFGTCAYYTLIAARNDMVGFVTSTSGGNIMAPWGGVTPLLGNNPISVAIPAGEERPVVLDMAMSVVAKGKIIHAMKSGTPIPSTWGLNSFGEPTTDAREAFEGLVQPVGGYKGYGMAFVFGVLSGLLNGAGFIWNVHSQSKKLAVGQNQGHIFQAIDVAAFMDPAEFKAKMDRAVREIHASQLARGAERVYVPGEIEWLTREKRQKEGIPIAAPVWNELVANAEGVGVPLPAAVSSE